MSSVVANVSLEIKNSSLEACIKFKFNVLQHSQWIHFKGVRKACMLRVTERCFSLLLSQTFSTFSIKYGSLCSSSYTNKGTKRNQQHANEKGM